MGLIIAFFSFKKMCKIDLFELAKKILKKIVMLIITNGYDDSKMYCFCAVNLRNPPLNIIPASPTRQHKEKS